MKQFILFFLLCSGISLNGQSVFGDDSFCSTGDVKLLVRFVTVDGQPAVPGQDSVAVIDSDGIVVGKAPVINLSGYQGCADQPGFSMNVFGATAFTPQFCTPAEYGLNSGETFRVTIYDGNTGLFYESDEQFTFTSPGSPFSPPSGAGSQCDIEDYSLPSNLPVTFASLSARDLGGKVRIDWATASESGNEYFEVEHSNTLGNFVALGRLAGAGESQQLLNYGFVHDNPAVGTNYYRIKQVDFEGAFSYSGIVPVEVATVQSEQVTVFPNPAASGYFNLNVGSDWNVSSVNVSVLNAVGRRVMEWNQDVTATRQVMTTDLAAGIYLVRVEGGKRTSTKRLIIK